MGIAGEVRSDFHDEILEIEAHLVASELRSIMSDVRRASDANQVSIHL